MADVQYLSIMRDNCKARSMINKKCAPSFMLDVPNWIGMRRQWEPSALPSCTATARPAPWSTRRCATFQTHLRSLAEDMLARLLFCRHQLSLGPDVRAYHISQRALAMVFACCE